LAIILYQIHVTLIGLKLAAVSGVLSALGMADKIAKNSSFWLGASWCLVTQCQSSSVIYVNKMGLLINIRIVGISKPKQPGVADYFIFYEHYVTSVSVNGVFNIDICSYVN
jgi:hypothetical protein